MCYLHCHSFCSLRMCCAVLVFCCVCCDVSSHGLQVFCSHLYCGPASLPAHMLALLVCAEKTSTLDVQIPTGVQSRRVGQDDRVSTIAHGVAAGISRACRLAWIRIWPRVTLLEFGYLRFAASVLLLDLSEKAHLRRILGASSSTETDYLELSLSSLSTTRATLIKRRTPLRPGPFEPSP
jgi:hypothetical protein